MNATPSVLFNTLTYVANTNPLVESQRMALQQSKAFHLELNNLQSKLLLLEVGLASNEDILRCLNDYDLVSGVIVDFVNRLFYFLFCLASAYYQIIKQLINSISNADAALQRMLHIGSC